ncbi:hypothetical protein KR009_003917, partial [Drosophila setifemur]
YRYTVPIFNKGRKGTLDSKDIYRVLKEHKSETLGNKLWASWERELESSRGAPNLLRALLRVFGWYFGLLGLVFIVELVVRALQPFFLLKLISYFSQGSESTGAAYYYAGGMILCAALQVVIIHQISLATTTLGLKMRVGLSSLIYRRVLRLSRTALGDGTGGHVVNLISNDLGRLDTFLMFTHYLWVGPLQVLVITYLMYREIGIAAVFGVALMLLFIPLLMYMGKRTKDLRAKTALRTDKRMRIMNEIIAGIQVIKMYAWELPFERLVSAIREKEVNAIRQLSFLKILGISYGAFLMRFFVFLSLVGFVLLGQILTAEVAFLITAYYNVLYSSMAVHFPLGITQTAEVLVSIKRVQQFMLTEEMEVDLLEETTGDRDEAVEKLLPPPSSSSCIEGSALAEGRISISGLKAKWDSKSPDYTLNDINLQVMPGTLLAIVGATGSGKSSLIQAILGELPAESGDIKVNGTMSYASQEPWLFSGTVRQNILFGQPMDRRRYSKVVKDCALERDFELLPFKDRTIVGERGASLSGGQKARISLARSVYRESSIYLLDDPLSAVDTHVARHLFAQCIRGYLRERIVILATHQLQFLQHCDQILVMDKGRVSALGSYESLHASGMDLSTILCDPPKEDQGEEAEDPIPDQRRNSEISLVSTCGSCSPENLEKEQAKILEERQESGRIGWGVYMDFFKAGGGLIPFLLMASICVCSQGLASLADYFLSYWVNKNGSLDNQVEKNTLSLESGVSESGLLRWLQDLGWSVDAAMLDIYLFTLIMVLTIVVSVGRPLLFLRITINASTRLHNAMFQGISRATLYFFNTNPSGRILNRFSKDMGQVDEMLPKVMMDFIHLSFALAGTIIILVMVNPMFILPTIVLSLILYRLSTFYLKTSNDVKRLEAINRSPVYSHVSASLTGLSTIRAFGAQRILEAEFDQVQDTHSSVSFMFISTSRAFGYWLDCLSVVYIAIVTFSFFWFPLVSGGAVGLAITQVRKLRSLFSLHKTNAFDLLQAMSLTGQVSWGVRQSAEMENNMINVERVLEYQDIEPEGALESSPDKKPLESWPEQGKIVFDELSLRYEPDPKAEKVLKSLSLVIKPKEKVGIVGRTGAGKSSLINALFRLSYNEGSILIDKRDTNDMGLHDLRSKISIIPQEPVLFSGTMRYNLDPFDEYSDDKLWRSLEEVKLKDVVADLPSGLQTNISEGGTNFSVGQRQLVCLARAILRENRILVMDEATANVDPQTDALIQTTIRNKFKDCTVLTIAHRLHTIMDSDKVLVMEAGEAVEFGSPYELLTESESKVFHGMVMQMGQATYESLLKVAQEVSSKINFSIKT